MSDGAVAAPPEPDPTPPLPPPGPDPYRDRFVPIASWALYDFANTLFSALVVTQYLPKVLKEETGHDRPMAWSMAGSMVVAAVLGPFLCAVADATGRTKAQVLLWSGVCCGGGVALSLVPPGHPGWLIAFFALANIAYNIGISLYDAFLPDLCSPGRMGYVSGVGVGVGDLGALLGYPVAREVTKAYGDHSAFAVAGVLMAVFTIPFAIFVRERGGARRPFTAELGFAEFRHAARTIAGLPARPVLLLFLAGNLLAVDSLNSMIQWAAQFFRDPAAFNAPESEVTWLLIGLALAGTIAGFVAGKVCDAVGPARVILSAVLALAVVATVDSITADRTLAIWVTVIGGGYGAAGVWLAGRRALVDLAPPDRLAEHMGLLGVTRKASVFGTVVLATLADSRDWRYAILALVAPLLAGATLLAIAARLHARRAESGATPIASSS
ncbi:MAG TPA: MFS transporter [Planctomycetota bacterium]|nr:MFS transporter [Planctomycetota bacterium]